MFKIGDKIECYRTAKKLKHITKGKVFILHTATSFYVYDKQGNEYPFWFIRIYQGKTKHKRKQKIQHEQLTLF